MYFCNTSLMNIGYSKDPVKITPSSREKLYVKKTLERFLCSGSFICLLVTNIFIGKGMKQLRNNYLSLSFFISNNIFISNK